MDNYDKTIDRYHIELFKMIEIITTQIYCI